MTAGYSVYTAHNNVKLSDLALNNVEALASGDENSDCPHGCLSVQGDGCWCYGWHEYHKENT